MDELAEALTVNTEGKTICHRWQTDDWQGYGRELSDAVIHEVSKALTQRLKRTNSILCQQTGLWHRKQNKFGQVWQQCNHLTACAQLFQLDLAIRSVQEYGYTTGRAGRASLDMARLGYHSTLC